MGLTLPYKFTGNGIDYLVEFFEMMFPGKGNLIVGLIGVPETMAIVLLLIPRYRVKGAIQTMAIMLGAIATHIYLGVFDALFAQAIITMAAATYIVNQSDPIRKLL